MRACVRQSARLAKPFGSRPLSTVAGATTPLPRHRYHARHQDQARHELIDKFLRVDHAGEFAAQRIYDGQLAVLKGTASEAIIQEMKSQEVEHLKNLEKVMPERRARPTVLLPFCDIAGFALGAGSAMLGEKAAMACTVAVEEVITEHYNDQIRTLTERGYDDESVLKEMIKKHRDDEEHHKQIGLDHHAEQAPFFKALTTVIKGGCKAAIWVTERV